MLRYVTSAIAALVLASGLARADYVDVGTGLVMHYKSAGEGETPVVFIPGWMMSTDAFEHQLAHFEGSQEYRAIAYDPRGQGLSGKTVEGHTYQQHARDLDGFIEALGLDDIVLVGWSYGVTEQLAYVDQFGAERIKAMVMIDTGPDVAGASRDEWVWYLDDDSDGYARWFTEGIIEARQDVITEFAKWMLEDPSAENLTFVSDIANMTSSSVAAIQNATAFYLDYSEDLKALEGSVPLMYVVREESEAVAERWIAANTPGAERHYMGKHMMFWERPDAFNAALQGFLRALDP